MEILGNSTRRTNLDLPFQTKRPQCFSHRIVERKETNLRSCEHCRLLEVENTLHDKDFSIISFVRPQDFRQPQSPLGEDQVLWVRHGLHAGRVQIAGLRGPRLPDGPGASGVDGLPHRHQGLQLRPPVPRQGPLVRHPVRQPPQGRLLREHPQLQSRIQVSQNVSSLSQ